MPEREPDVRGAAWHPKNITRPEPVLLTYYTIVSLFSGPLFPLVYLPLYLRYKTMRYSFDDEGVSMSYGALMKRETFLTYRRIQDIHLTRGIVQRKLGLANLAIQTASGGGPEMTIEGITEAEALRDYLYAKMRGAKDDDGEDEGADASGGDEALELLHEIRDALNAAAQRKGGE